MVTLIGGCDKVIVKVKARSLTHDYTIDRHYVVDFNSKEYNVLFNVLFDDTTDFLLFRKLRNNIACSKVRKDIKEDKQYAIMDIKVLDY